MVLLVVVSLVQVGVAAYTFFELQTGPAESRVRAQLDGSLRATAPVVDAAMDDARERGDLVRGDASIAASVDVGDWAAVEASLVTILADAEADAFSDANSVPPNGDDPALVDAADPEVSTTPVDGLDSTSDELGSVYVTDSTGEVVVGEQPDDPVLDDGTSTAVAIERGGSVIATVHLPVVFDDAFLGSQIAPYVGKGIRLLVASDDELRLVDHDGAVETVKRPDRIDEGLSTITLDGSRRRALVQPVLDGGLLIGATVPESRIVAQERSGVSSLWGFIAVLVVLTVVIALLVSRAVGDALHRFAESARALAGGELDRRIPVVGGDEIAVLSESFNDMAENLQDRIVGLTNARAQLKRQVELFGDALANATDESDMLKAVLSLAMESTHATHARFWTITEDGRYQHAACVGLRASDVEPCPLERAVTTRNASVRGAGTPYWLVVPARSSDKRIVGMMTLVSTTSEFTADDVRMAERIAVQAAVAIDNARMHERLRLQATRDGLTGLPNHRSLQDELTSRLDEAYGSSAPLGVVLLDIDNFKRVNDTYGHPVGDEAIKAIGRALDQGMGGMGMVGRYGGEEFVVILPGCDADTSCRIADRLREDITRIEIPLDDGGVLKVTSSFGVANVDQQRERVGNADIFHQADVGLYNAKRTGKNKVVLAGPDTVVIEMSEAEQAKLAARERGDVAAEQAAAAALETTPAAAVPADPWDLAA